MCARVTTEATAFFRGLAAMRLLTCCLLHSVHFFACIKAERRTYTLLQILQVALFAANDAGRGAGGFASFLWHNEEQVFCLTSPLKTGVKTERQTTHLASFATRGVCMICFLGFSAFAAK